LRSNQQCTGWPMRDDTERAVTGAETDGAAQAIFSSASRFGRTFTCVSGRASVASKSGIFVLRGAGTANGMPVRLTRLTTCGAAPSRSRRTAASPSAPPAGTDPACGAGPSQPRRCRRPSSRKQPAQRSWPTTPTASCAGSIALRSSRRNGSTGDHFLACAADDRAGRRAVVVAHGVEPRRVVNAELEASFASSTVPEPSRTENGSGRPMRRSSAESGQPSSERLDAEEAVRSGISTRRRRRRSAGTYNLAHVFP